MKIEHAYILYIDTPDSVQYMEECKASCEKYGIPVTPFKGKKFPNSSGEVLRDWGFKINTAVDDSERIKDPIMQVWLKEQLCLTGHLSIWKKIRDNHRGAVAILEHDAIVKRNFLDVDVDDLELVFLGYRVDHRDDYECVDDPFIKHSINKFEGTHGYAITPSTANACLNALDEFVKERGCLPLGVSIDHMLGVQNGFKLPMSIVDPAPVVAAVEDKISHTQPEAKVARYNMAPHNGFIKGLKNTDKYKYDAQNNWLVF
jgi:GR25 family glycosyltransferase involved in LPS biosynthesis